MRLVCVWEEVSLGSWPVYVSRMHSVHIARRCAVKDLHIVVLLVEVLEKLVGVFEHLVGVLVLEVSSPDHEEVVCPVVLSHVQDPISQLLCSPLHVVVVALLVVDDWLVVRAAWVLVAEAEANRFVVVVVQNVREDLCSSEYVLVVRAPQELKFSVRYSLGLILVVRTSEEYCIEAHLGE